MNTTLMTLQTVTMDWKLKTFLGNLLGDLKVYGSGAIMILGVIMILVAAFQIGKGLMSGGKGQTNWIMALGCLVIGGMFLSSGYNLVAKIGKGAGSSIEDLGKEGKENNESHNIKKAGEGETIILPFGDITAHIDMK